MVTNCPDKKSRELGLHRLRINKAKVDILLSSRLAASVPGSVTENILKPIWSGDIEEISVIYRERVKDKKIQQGKILWFEWFLV